jgi:hypothetical protein
MSIDNLGVILTDAIRAYGIGDPRSQQSRDGILGPSDIGFCRQKAALTTRGVPQSDEKSIAAAQVGTAIHRYVAEAFKAANPDNWIVEDHRVTATLPSGVEISGTPDLICQDWNAVIDVKTVDGFEWVKREGTSLNHKYQRHLYALGAIQEGLLNDKEPMYVGCLYIDRSGKEKEPLLLVQEFDWSLTDEIDSWIGDVIYAVKHNEDAARDIPAPVCNQICEFFTVCRGNLPVEDGGESITDHDRIEAISMWLEGKALESEGVKKRKAASLMLTDTNGVANVDGAVIQVRWVHVNPTQIAAQERAGYSRLDVRPLKTPK